MSKIYTLVKISLKFDFCANDSENTCKLYTYDRDFIMCGEQNLQVLNQCARDWLQYNGTKMGRFSLVIAHYRVRC